MSDHRRAYAQNLTNEIVTGIGDWLNEKMSDIEFGKLENMIYKLVERKTIITKEKKMLECTGKNHRACYPACSYRELSEAVEHWKNKKPCTESFICELTGEVVKCKEVKNEK